MGAQPIQDDLHREIVDQLVVATPEWWKEAKLELIRTTKDGVDSCQHSIVSKQFPKDIVVATDELFEATRKLVLHHKALGHRWKSAVYEIHQDESGNWRFVVEFLYD